MSTPNELPSAEQPPETQAAPESTPAAAPPPETQTAPAAYQQMAPPPSSPDYGPYLAQQNQVLAGLMNQIAMQSRPPEKEEELPDPTLEPDKYVNRVVEKKIQQFQPMLTQMHMQNAVNTALLTREQVSKEIGPEWGKYEGVIGQLAGQFDPQAFANPAAWKALYFMAKGAESTAPVPAPASASPQATGPAAPQGQWPGARQAPPPVAAPGSGTPAPTGARRLSDEERKYAKIYGMTDDEYAKLAEEA